jgi:hypothetical protein
LPYRLLICKVESFPRRLSKLRHFHLVAVSLLENRHYRNLQSSWAQSGLFKGILVQQIGISHKHFYKLLVTLGSLLPTDHPILCAYKITHNL